PSADAQGPLHVRLRGQGPLDRPLPRTLPAGIAAPRIGAVGGSRADIPRGRGPADPGPDTGHEPGAADQRHRRLVARLGPVSVPQQRQSLLGAGACHHAAPRPVQAGGPSRSPGECAGTRTRARPTPRWRGVVPRGGAAAAPGGGSTAGRRGGGGGAPRRSPAAGAPRGRYSTCGAHGTIATPNRRIARLNSSPFW